MAWQTIAKSVLGIKNCIEETPTGVINVAAKRFTNEKFLLWMALISAMAIR